MDKKPIKVNYGELLDKVSKILEEARKKTVRQINAVMVETYWHIGKLIVKEEQEGKEKAQYGIMLLPKLSKDLTVRYGKGFSVDNLELMRKFYLLYNKAPGISETSSRKLPPACLSWSHYCELLSVDDEKARSFYHIEAYKNSWSVRELRRQINSLLFERLSLSKSKGKVLQLAAKGQVIEKPEDAVKNPYVLEFLGIPEKSYYTESQLEQKLINHLQDFILELGGGFSFIGRQKRITFDNEHYYIDLVFYHRVLRCLVLIDLKIGALSHADIGQMNFYLNYIKVSDN